MTARNYSNTATEATLTGSVTAGDTSITLAAFAGFPSAPFTAAIDRGTATEEIVLVTAVSGSTVTATRGYDSTTAKSHSAGATFLHVVVAKDYAEAALHANAVAAHGTSSQVVGISDTQTLTNKTLNTPVLASPTVTGTFNAASAALSGTLTVTGAASVGSLTVGGSASVTGTVSGATATAAGHLVRKDQLDAVGARVTTAEGTLAAATNGSAPSTLVKRDATGDALFNQVGVGAGAPTASNHLARKDYVDSAIAALPKIQTGTVTANLSNSSFSTGTVTFPTPFTTAPTIITGVSIASGSNIDLLSVIWGSNSTVGFSWRVRERSSTNVTLNATLHWIAVGT
jgi:hypothetical protein